MAKPFISLFNKEFYAWFSSLQAYIIFVAYVALSLGTTFYLGNFFSLNNQALASFFNYQPMVLVLLIPAITMHIWTDENRSSTIDFLLTQPVSYLLLVVSKFFAAWFMGLLLLIISLPLAISSSFFINLDWLNIFSAYLGCILLIGSFTSIGCCISALSSNSVITYLFSILGALGLIYFNPNFLFSWFGENKLNLRLDFSSQYLNLISGQISLSEILYFGLIIALSLWLNIVVITHKKTVNR